MLRTLAIIFGLSFVAAGILGFVPEFTKQGKLFGLFKINPEHNFFHLITGIIALWCGFKNLFAIRTFFQVFGVIYGVIAVLGFFFGEQDLLGVIANNMADTLLHLGIAIVSLYLGFGYRS